MTPKKTANRIVLKFNLAFRLPGGYSTEVAAEIEEAIIAAVLEEREACAKVPADYYDSLPDNVVGLWGPPLLIVEELIRDRCNGGEK